MAKTFRSLIGMSLLLAAVSASAQIRHTVRITVPFPFVTAEKSWPAAEYQVDVTPENGIVTLSTGNTTPATALTTPADSPETNKAQLRFQCSGDQWVLHEVVLDGTARIFPVTRLEKEQADVSQTCQERVLESRTAIQ